MQLFAALVGKGAERGVVEGRGNAQRLEPLQPFDVVAFAGDVAFVLQFDFGRGQQLGIGEQRGERGGGACLGRGCGGCPRQRFAQEGGQPHLGAPAQGGGALRALQLAGAARAQPAVDPRRRQRRAAQLGHRGFQQLRAPPQARHRLVADQAEFVSIGGQAAVGVVLAQHQPMLGARGEHAVRLARRLGHQVVDQHPDVGFVAPQDQLLAAAARPAPQRQRGVDAGHQALRRGLLVAGGAVHLAGEVEPAQPLALQRGVHLAGGKEVVLHGVAVARRLRLLQAAHGAQGRLLHLRRQRTGEAVEIDQVAVQPLRLQEQLMAAAVGEAHHLVFDGGAVARPGAADAAGKHRRAVEARGQRRVGGGVGKGHVAAHLRQARKPGRVGAARERRRMGVARLLVERAEVDAGAPQPGRGAGLEAPGLQTQAPERLRQAGGRLLAVAPAGAALQAGIQHAVEKGAGGHHQRPAADLLPGAGYHRGHPPIAGHHVHYGLLDDRNGGLRRHQRLRRGGVRGAVRLAPGGPDRRPLGAVQQPELDAGGIRQLPHHPAEGVDLVHQVALGRAADGRVARHAANGRGAAGDQARAAAHARGRHRRLDAGVSAANYDQIEHRFRLPARDVTKQADLRRHRRHGSNRWP